MNWYFRHDGSVSGPVPQLALERYLLLGRIEIADEVSLDQVNWRKIAEVPEFAKTISQMHEFDESRQHAIEAIEHEHEAAPETPRPETASPIEQAADLREAIQSGKVVDLETARAALFAPIEEESKSWKGYLLLAILVCLAGAGAYFFRPVNPIKVGIIPECGKPPAPDVNWNSCDKGGVWLNNANLTHANLDHTRLNSAQIENGKLAQASLNGADLSYANLKGADLQGADLSNSDLRDSDLTGAKLTGAILTGARLDGATFIDGRQCAPQSLGKCR